MTEGIKYVAHSPPEGVAWDLAHTLQDHLVSVGTMSSHAASVFDAEEWGRYAGLWHDVGKGTAEFQSYIRGGRWKSHKLAGAGLALERYPNAAGRTLACIIAGHHGGMKAWDKGDDPLKDQQVEMANELKEVSLEVRHWVEEQRVLAWPEWIKDLSKKKVPDIEAGVELFTRMVYSSLVDSDWLDTAKYYNPNEDFIRSKFILSQDSILKIEQRLNAYIDQRFCGAADTLVNRARRDVLEGCRAAGERPRGMFSLTVPTGGGKTLSAMAFALRHAVRHGMRRVIVVVPYTSIIEQNAAVFREALGAENVLEHHGNWEVEPTSSRQRGRLEYRQRLLAENWDAPVIITTSVQFLESLHAHQPARCRKLHRIANSVVIFDEVQTLPVGLLDVTLQTLRMLVRGFGVSLVTCTATQPALDQWPRHGSIKKGLGELQPLLSNTDTLFSVLKRVDVRWPKDLQVASQWAELVEELREEKQVLAIVHRRKDAQELLDALGDEDALHLSALMLPDHRRQVLREVRRRLGAGQRCRVISTQLVEAGVDVDFPVVYRAMAGLDALAQSAGRCNREGRLTRGQFRIFVAPTEPPPGVLRAAKDLAVTMVREQRGAVDLDAPALYRAFYARLYGQAETDSKKLLSKRGDFPTLAHEYRMIDTPFQTPLIVPWNGLQPEVLEAVQALREGQTGMIQFRLIRRATIAVSRSLVEGWQRQGFVSQPEGSPLPILELERCPSLYNERVGLRLEENPEYRPEMNIY